MAMSDYIAVMDKGQVAQFDAPRALYEKPRTRFVASFLGSINLFDGSAQDMDSRQLRFVTSEGLGILLERNDRIDSNSVRAVGFRPEKLLVSRNPTNLANDFRGAIEQITYGGTLSHTAIRLAGGRRLDATLMNVHDSAANGLLVGDAVHVGFPSEAGVAFTE